MIAACRIEWKPMRRLDSYLAAVDLRGCDSVAGLRAPWSCPPSLVALVRAASWTCSVLVLVEAAMGAGLDVGEATAVGLTLQPRPR